MGKNRSPNREKAFILYKKYKGEISAKEISIKLDEKVRNIYEWKKQDQWDIKINKKVGAPPGNKNAVGNKGGGAPRFNENNLKHGKYRKYIPKTTKQLIDNYKKLGATPIDILKENIYMAQSELINRMSLMKNEEVKRIKKIGKGITEYEYETQHQQNVESMREFTRLIDKISKLVKDYESLTGQKYLLEIEEKQLNIEKLKRELNKSDKDVDKGIKLIIDYGGNNGSN